MPFGEKKNGSTGSLGHRLLINERSKQDVIDVTSYSDSRRPIDRRKQATGRQQPTL
jgi:hypothetical protein